MIDLQNIEAYRENNRIEAKRATGGFPHSLWETYSAFANTIGGLILLGVEESKDKSFRVVGVPDSAGYLSIFWSHINDILKVSANILSPKDVNVQILDGKEIIMIQVPRAHRHERPIFLDGNPFSGSYRRDGEGDYHCTPEEVRSMLRDREDTPADLAPLTTLSLDDLHLESLRQFRLLMAMRNPSHSWNALPDPDFLRMTGGSSWDAPKNNMHPTVAGLLLFGRYPALMQTFTSYHLEYREELENGISIRSGEGSWSGNLFDFYERVSARLKEVSEAISPQNPAVESSMREAAVNAILHTDYYGGQGLHILRFPDALQVSNSGLFRVSPEQVQRDRITDCRNIGLSRLFSLIGVGNEWSVGLRGIYRTWAKQGWSAPTLTESFGPDSTSLHLPLRSFPRDKLQQAIVEFLTRTISAQPKELSRHLNVTPLLLQKALSTLQQEGLVSKSYIGEQVFYSLRA